MDVADSLSTIAAAGLGIAGFTGFSGVTGLIWFLFHAAVQFSRMLFVQPADR